MAIITDPDALDRAQIIFGPTSTRGGSLTGVESGVTRTISMSEVGTTQITGPLTNGATTAGDAFITTATDPSGAVAGDIIAIYSGSDQGHYLVASSNTTSVTIDTTSSDYPFTDFDATETNIIFDVFDPDTGTIADGVSEQALYSFCKEEWKTDTGSSAIDAAYSDDLIRHPFPFEGITPTQFEIGGGASHDNWNYHNLHTKNLVRSGGWRLVNAAGTAQAEYAGFVSLGAMDADAQPYYQLVNETTAKTNFAFTGPVNEGVLLFENGGSDNRGYFKAFLRKKAKTYASYNLLVEQNLTTLTYKDFAFPLTHVADAAITASDGEIVGIAPFSGQTGTNRDVVLRTAPGTVASVDAVDTNGVYTFEKTGETFATDGVRVGDSVKVTAGNNNGKYFQVTAVAETAITVANIVTDLAADAFTTGTGTETIEVYTKYIVEGRTDGVLGSGVGTLTSATGGFDTGATQVRAGDMVIITEAASSRQGVYKVVSQDSATQLTLNVTDITTAFAGETGIDFEVVRPSMFAQYRFDEIVAAATDAGAGYTFADADPDTITATTSIFGSVAAGDIVTVASASNSLNNGTFTVASATATELTLVGTDTLTASSNDTTATIAINRGFSRTINSVTYGFKWRVFGNGASLGDVYQFLQHQLRQTTDIDYGYNGGTAFVGEITDSLLSFQTPTGTTQNMYIDDLNADDVNNVTFIDATGNERNEKFLATFTIQFNQNLLDDNDTTFTMFYLNDDSGDNTGRDYGTKDAIIVNDNGGSPITGTNPSGDLQFEFDFDNNVQRGAASANTNANVVIVAIGLNTSQFVRFDGQITRNKGQSFSLVAALERNYAT